MRKLFFLVIFMMSVSIYSQDNNDTKQRHHEIKANAFNLIVFKSIDFSYEYLIDSESSIGMSALFNLQDNEDKNFEDGPYYNEKFALTPFYRRYFSSKYAWGFFLEAFAMYNLQEDYFGNDYYNLETGDYYYDYSEESSSNFAFGMSIGGKFVSSKGFAFEFFGGIGRNLITSNDNVATELVPRLGVNLGFRF